MADVSGPCRTLPGAMFSSLVGVMCDDHPDRASVKRVQGETDSFGAEYFDMCQECYDAFANRDRTEERSGMCDWCKGAATDLRNMRDYEEGSYGPVYRVCGKCVSQQLANIREELDSNPRYGDDSEW